MSKSSLLNGAIIEIDGTEYSLRWPLSSLKWMKDKYGLTLDKINFTDPDDTVAFILAGLRKGPGSHLNEDEVADGVDLFGLLAFGQEFSKIQEEVTGPLTDAGNSGPSAE